MPSETVKEWIAKDELRFLSRSAVFLRYPGESAEKDEAKEAMKLTKRIRARLISLLND
jgi:hypothetical protein